MIKDVLVHLSASPKETASAYALDLARAFDAHISGVAFAYEPVIVPGLMGGYPADFIDAQRAESEAAAGATKQRFDAMAARAGVAAKAAASIFPGSVAGAAEQFAEMARRFDISVVMQEDADAGGPEGLIAESALFQSGRPVIVVPYIQKGGLATDRILVCWDGGRTAARAVGDAMPLLKRSKQVEIVIVTGEDRKRDEVPGADIAEHLARHNLNVDVKRIVAQGNVHETLQSYAADRGADMMVMGGYGHSRLREFVLGGVTRGMLASMTVPCLMSH